MKISVPDNVWDGRSTTLLYLRHKLDQTVSQTRDLDCVYTMYRHACFYSLLTACLFPWLCFVLVPVLAFAYFWIEGSKSGLVRDVHHFNAMLAAYEQAVEQQNPDDAVYIGTGLLSTSVILNIDNDGDHRDLVPFI